MKKFTKKIIGLLSIFTLAGCIPGMNNKTTDITVLLDDGSKASGIEVKAYDGSSTVVAVTDENGVAKLELKDETGYSLYIHSNGYALTSENHINKNSNISVTLSKIQNISVGEGLPYTPYIIHEGTYEVSLKGTDTVFYGFRPTRPGKYIVESWADLTLDPQVGFYGNNDQYVAEAPLDDEKDDNSGMDNNFKLELNIPIDQFINTGNIDKDGNLIYEKDANGNYIPGGSYKLGINNKDNLGDIKFPITVKWVEEYVEEKVIAEKVYAEETLTKYPNNENKELIYKEAELNGTLNVVYNEEDKFYHVDSKDGYVLLAKISEPCPYLDRPFSKVNPQTGENEGILSVTGIVVDNGKKDYAEFVKEYEKYCNEDGVYPVTQEMKTFLELYFLKIQDWVISTSETVVDEESGWLFACGYYANIADAYDKPWSGNGTTDEPFSINTGEYYAKVSAGTTIYYRYYLKNTLNEKTMFVKTDNSDAIFIHDGVEYSSEDGAYFEVVIGGHSHDGGFIFGVTTKSDIETGFVFKLAEKEKTVAGDQIILGENTVEVEEMGVVECSYKVAKAGTYTFTCSEKNAWIEDMNGNSYKGNQGEITFSYDMKVNEVFTFNVYTIDFKQDYITFKLECDSLAKLGINRVSVAAWETVEYTFKATETATYEFKCETDNTVIGFSNNGFTEFKYGNSSDNSFKLSLNKDQKVYILLTTANNKKDTVVFSITKL